MKTSDTTLRTNDTRFIKEVLGFYTTSGRHDLIWRKSITPYKILVSEVMLQQTQVSRVLPKFILWMKAYPTLARLKAASLKDVLSLWQGLGYQRRAKALCEVARSVKVLPTTYEELLDLSGIGPYTASAVCAFAYNVFPPKLLETNIRTALIESFHQGETEIHDGILYDDLNRLQAYLSVRKVGARDWYYALMDYGAHLKSQKISHNQKSAHYVRQTPYKGSLRELRAKILFAITHDEKLPIDERVTAVLDQLVKEGYLLKKKTRYTIA